MSDTIEMEILFFICYVILGAMAFFYNEKFLHRKFIKSKSSIFLWIIIYSVPQMIISELLSRIYPHNNSVIILPNIIIMFILQNIFFERNITKQIFVISSFTAAWEILRFTASPLAYTLYNLWNPIFSWLVNDWLINNFTINEDILPLIKNINRFVSVLVIAICRIVQILLLAVYLNIISKNFARKDYELRLQESLFLIVPCFSVLLIDLTIRLMAVSVDNGAIYLIYSRVPETTFLLPIMSILLLTMVISSVVLFRNMVKFKDEEQKRLLLENRVIEVHREIEDLSNIYADIRGLRHDLRNHIANIAAYVRKNSKNDEINHYLDQMNETIEHLDFFYKTGNAITDIILHQNLQNARKKNIRFNADFHFPKNLNIDIYDVSIILNNSLQNTLESAEKEINIRSYCKGNLFFIEVSNDFSHEINFKDGLPMTTKADKNLHGLGLANIQRCAQKYNGDVEINISKQTFNLTIMLYGKNY